MVKFPWIVCFIFMVGFSTHGILVTSEFQVKSFPEVSQLQESTCKKIRISDQVGCICVTGLWRLYSDCSSFYSIAGNFHCFKQFPKGLSSKSHTFKDVTFAMEVLSSPESITLIRNSSNLIELGNRVHGATWFKTPSFAFEDLIVTGSRYTIKGPRGSVCFSPQSNAYCTYRQPMDLIGGNVQNITKGCVEDIPFVAPIYCDFMKEPKLCDDESSLESESQLSIFGLEDELEDEDLTIKELSITEMENNNLPSHIREKRKTKGIKIKPLTTSSRKALSPKAKSGRTFLGVAEQGFDQVVGLEDMLDEDFLSAELLKNLTMMSSDAVLSEIWNYVETQAEIVMGLRKPPENEVDYDMPYFKLLHMAKKVMQKVCPPYYVPPGFFDVATQAFIQVQVKRIIYSPPNANFPGFRRIMSAMELCLKNMTMYPFLTPDNVNETVLCKKDSIGKGQYVMFDEQLEITIPNSFVGLNKDPIIETVWKIFYAAHSFCFPFFKASSFNDHHRFTAWLMPLFKTSITEIWMSGSASEMTYGQFLGNLEEVMVKVAYCAASSRLSPLKVAYPWELPRPIAEPEKPKNTVKRSIIAPLTSCLDDRAASQCFSTAKPFSSFLTPTQAITQQKDKDTHANVNAKKIPRIVPTLKPQRKFDKKAKIKF